MARSQLAAVFVVSEEHYVEMIAAWKDVADVATPVCCLWASLYAERGPSMLS